MARETPANIRAAVIQAVNDICIKPNLTVLTRGVRWLRFGRYLVSTTTTPGQFLLCVMVEDCTGYAAYRGPLAVLATLVSQEMRDAWLASGSGERDSD